MHHGSSVRSISQRLESKEQPLGFEQCFTSCGGMSNEIVRRSTFTKESVQGKMKKIPTDSREGKRVTFDMETEKKKRKHF